MKFKTQPASERYEAARLEFVLVLQKYGDDLRPDEQLAIAAYFVGQLMAVQDATVFTAETAFELVMRNIEMGNAEAVNSILSKRNG